MQKLSESRITLMTQITRIVIKRLRDLGNPISGFPKSRMKDNLHQVMLIQCLGSFDYGVLLLSPIFPLTTIHMYSIISTEP